MKKYTTKELNEIIEEMKNGTNYCGIDRGYGEGRIWYKRSLGEDGNIYYRHYGQSAIHPTTRDLRWLLETIFVECSEIVPAVWSDYHINYIPEDSKYVGVDMSTSHPNVCGL